MSRTLSGAADSAYDPMAMNDPTDALADRLFRDARGALELFTVYLGERLGLYRALAEGGPMTSTELADRVGTNERYIREWLEHHAASGLLEVDDVSAAPQQRTFYLPAASIPVLADPDDERFATHRAIDVARAARALPDLVDAFRTGSAPPSQPWEPEGRAADNRPTYLRRLGREWLPAIADVDRRLRSDPPARVADVACGMGWSSIAIAQAYPRVSVAGFDLDADAIADATRNAAAEGVADRVSFSVADATEPGLPGRFNLVTILEGFHDLARPVEALRAVREMLAPDGSVLLIDERVADEFTAPAPELERYHYAWSVLSCLPGAMGDPATAATGAVMRLSILQRYAEEAGFHEVEVLPMETQTWRFYRLHR
jgi:2-polyprenyl-3-methyl-5-hydroxy-6-metoxy-1,4-benzoquinol methylase